MQYTVVITRQPDAGWRAFVPGWPECTVEAETREAVLAQIKDRLAEIVPQSEVVRLDLPFEPDLIDAPRELELQTDWADFGCFRDDPSWGELFAEIEHQRDECRAGE